MGNLTGWHALIVLAVVLLIFGAAKLPMLARSVGQSVKILKKEIRTEAPRAATDAESTVSPKLHPAGPAADTIVGDGRPAHHE